MTLTHTRLVAWVRTVGWRPLLITSLISAAVAAQTPSRFYADDPLLREPETQDAAKVRPWEVSDDYEVLRNSLSNPGDRADIRALSVNTLDEVPDSGWYTNRLGWDVRPLSSVPTAPEGNRPAPGPLTIVESKPSGLQPGFVVADARGARFFIKFDPPGNAEMASAAEVISTDAFRAFGYFVPDNYLIAITPELLKISPDARVWRDGRMYPFSSRDLSDILFRAAKSKDGSYRAMASKEIPGKSLGPFRYYGTRPDDPNDIYPHEHRRELRGMRVIAAWLNHHDVKSNNSFDTLLDVAGRNVVRHYVFDFGATLGSGSSEAASRRAGNEFVWEARPALITMLTFGLYVKPWLKLDYPSLPSVGFIESDYFKPEDWKADFPNPAFANARADDTFWAARRIAAFSDDAVRSLVRTAAFSDPEATKFLTEILIKRREKVLRRWLTPINPVVDFSLDADGTLAFRNAAVDAGVADAPSDYRVAWATFDNRTGSVGTLSEPGSNSSPRAEMPSTLSMESGYVVAEISTLHTEHPAWAQPTRVTFRRNGAAWQTVGVERRVVDSEER